jgi:hypothetical protein
MRNLSHGKKNRFKEITLTISITKMVSEKKREYDKKYRETHKEEIAQHAKEYRENHKEEIAAKSKEYYNENKHYFADYHKKYGKIARETKKTVCVCGRECAYRYNKDTHEKSIFHVMKTTSTMVGKKVKISGVLSSVVEHSDDHIKVQIINSAFPSFTIYTIKHFEECGGQVIF